MVQPVQGTLDCQGSKACCFPRDPSQLQSTSAKYLYPNCEKYSFATWVPDHRKLKKDIASGTLKSAPASNPSQLQSTFKLLKNLTLGKAGNCPGNCKTGTSFCKALCAGKKPALKGACSYIPCPGPGFRFRCNQILIESSPDLPHIFEHTRCS